MRRFITAGMVGIAQVGGEIPATGAPSDSLVGMMRDTDIERAYLLRAGAAAVGRAAGYVPARLDEAPTGAFAESLTTCNPAVEQLIASVMGDRSEDLIVEALDLLRRSGQALSPVLLPTALDLRAPALRAVIAPVLGERGRWLSQFNPAWAWVAQTVADDGASGELPADAEALWQEGATGQRIEILRRLRAVDPGLARQWLMDTWKREKADTRADLLKTFATGLSLDDEPLLESALDDRAAAVRAVAVDLLARLPGSAFAGRMRERAENMLTHTNGKLDAKPPTQLPADWQRDGVGQKSSSGRGERAACLTQIVSMVPCAVWPERFGQPPESLIAAVEESRWRDALLEGWTQSAGRFAESEWALLLWRRWCTPPTKADARLDRDDLRDTVAPLVPIAEREAYAASFFTATGTIDAGDFGDALGHLPTPWTPDFGHAYIAALRAFVAALDPKAKDAAQWDETPNIAMLALPSACFEAALEPLELPESDVWRIQHFRGQLDQLADTIRLRKQLYEEILHP